MSENTEIIFMQTRVLRLAAERWNTSIQKACGVFDKFGIFRFIRECYGIFHTEGDEAVLEEVMKVLDYRGVDIRAEIN